MRASSSPASSTTQSSQETLQLSKSPSREHGKDHQWQAEPGGFGSKAGKVCDTLRSKRTSSRMNDELPKRISLCLNRAPWYQRPRIRCLLLQEPVKSKLEAIEQVPQFLIGFEILLCEKMGVIKEALSPAMHLLLLEDLAALAEMYFACHNRCAIQTKRLFWYLAALAELQKRGEI
uniref:ARAD1B18414p n=1 Tax=Blastobotrys adeninivorans TaxID=409370 RepID=A0A060T7E4_BLAAD